MPFLLFYQQTSSPVDPSQPSPSINVARPHKNLRPRRTSGPDRRTSNGTRTLGAAPTCIRASPRKPKGGWMYLTTVPALRFTPIPYPGRTCWIRGHVKPVDACLCDEIPSLRPNLMTGCRRSPCARCAQVASSRGNLVYALEGAA